MCTPTDRALAIEELEHLHHQIKKWIKLIENDNQRHKQWYAGTEEALKEMRQINDKIPLS
jgi:hypothetical protein